MPKPQTSKKKSTPARRVAPLGGKGASIASEVGKALVRVLPELLPMAMAMPTSGTSVQLGSAQIPGALTVMAPANSARVRKGVPPTYGRSSPTGDITVSKRELVTTLVVPAAAGYSQILAVDLTPSNGGMAPWLSTLATRYESFQFLELTFILEPNAGTSSNGKVYMGVNPNASAAPPINGEGIMNYMDSVSGPVWSPLVLPVRRETLSLISGDKAISGDGTPDDLLTKSGTLYLGLNPGLGLTAGSEFGELYVDYSVRLKRPTTEAGAPCCCIVGGDTAAGAAALSGTLPNVLLSNPDANAYFILANTRIAGDFAVKPHQPPTGSYATAAPVQTFSQDQLADGLIFQNVGFFLVNISTSFVTNAWPITGPAVQAQSIGVHPDAARYVQILRMMSNAQSSGINGASNDGSTQMYIVYVEQVASTGNNQDTAQSWIRFLKPVQFTTPASGYIYNWKEFLVVTQLDDTYGRTFFPSLATANFVSTN